MKNLKTARAKKRFTQQMLAKELGVSRSCVSMWETGESQPDNNTLVRIADILDVSTDYLLGREAKVEIKDVPDGYAFLSEEGKRQIDSLIAMLLK